MKIGLDFKSLKENRWSEYAVRFFFGGVITAAAGVIAKEFGPEVAGLLLAFPAIFPASCHYRETRKREDGTCWIGRNATRSVHRKHRCGGRDHGVGGVDRVWRAGLEGAATLSHMGGADRRYAVVVWSCDHSVGRAQVCAERATAGSTERQLNSKLLASHPS